MYQIIFLKRENYAKEICPTTTVQSWPFITETEDCRDKFFFRDHNIISFSFSKLFAWLYGDRGDSIFLLIFFQAIDPKQARGTG